LNRTLNVLLPVLLQALNLEEGEMTLIRDINGWVAYTSHNISFSCPTSDRNLISDLAKALKKLNLPEGKFTDLPLGVIEGKVKVKVTYRMKYPEYLFIVKPLNNHEKLTNLGRYFTDDP
jgi:predicted DNA-binding antitoxin AbrB/MazE fold protein